MAPATSSVRPHRYRCLGQRLDGGPDRRKRQHRRLRLDSLDVGTATINDNSSLSGSYFEDPYGVAVDSSGNIWMTNFNSVTELSPTNASGSVSVTGSYAPPGANFSANVSTPLNVAIDASGNVWIANNGSSSGAEIIGVAGPVFTPLEACLKQATPKAVCLP
jgi:secreted PhoX family phosphatase